MKRKICVVSGSRADYGLLRWLMQDIRDSKRLQLQLVATGMHLSPEFGLTWREIERDGFTIDRRVEMLLSSDSARGVTKSMGVGLIGFADVLAELKPDLLLLLGDRFEILPAACAALVARIPIAHLHGGETTEGAFDEAIRHSLTKMSHLHFVATDEYRRRVIQLGEDPARVHMVGGLGIDAIARTRLLSRAKLEKELDFKLGKRNLLITFHPVTLEQAPVAAQMRALLKALEKLPDTRLIFTLPNADTDGRALIAMIKKFVATHPQARAYTSLGQLRYLSLLRLVDGVVGNSSSGLLEAPSFRKGTVNIGTRQDGRLRARSVIDCAPTQAAITAALRRLYSAEFRRQLAIATNPYGDGGASRKIVRVLEQAKLDGLVKKSFYDLPTPQGLP
jgi:GDP/UDP-N,N'-diacetylbacillosamine 2-epimerase (hydrolysing)